jgi:hypothetical protein
MPAAIVCPPVRSMNRPVRQMDAQNSNFFFLIKNKKNMEIGNQVNNPFQTLTTGYNYHTHSEVAFAAHNFVAATYTIK